MVLIGAIALEHPVPVAVALFGLVICAWHRWVAPVEWPWFVRVWLVRREMRRALLRHQAEAKRRAEDAAKVDIFKRIAANMRDDQGAA